MLVSSNALSITWVVFVRIIIIVEFVAAIAKIIIISYTAQVFCIHYSIQLISYSCWFSEYARGCQTVFSKLLYSYSYIVAQVHDMHMQS